MLYRCFLITFFFILTQQTYAQYSNVRGCGAIIDSIPNFMYQKAELDTYLIFCARIPPLDELYGANSEVKLEFHVDSVGRMNNLSVLRARVYPNPNIDFSSDEHEKDAQKYYSDEAIRLVKASDGLWIPGKKNGAYVDNRVIIDVVFKTSAYDKNTERDNKGLVLAKSLTSISKMKYYYDFGVKKMSQKKYGCAIMFFKEAIEFYPNDKDAWYNLGVAYKKFGRPDAACECWKAGTALNDPEATKLVQKYCN